MHFSTPTLLAAAAMIPSSMAHYCFNKLIVDGNYTGEYEYVRKNTNSNSPVTDLTSTDLRCNVGGLESGNTTSTYKVTSGTQLGFGLDTAIGHPGPIQVYLSAAPTGISASAYDGSGPWFKIYELGVREITSEGLQWAANQIQNFTFTLPAEVPAGQYLLRAESIALHGASTVGAAQYYISCAQLEVESASQATPEPTVEIPGLYTGTEPGIEINIYYPIPTNYTMPGPAVWPAGSGGSGSNSTSTSGSASNANATSSVVVASATTSSVSSSVAVEATTSSVAVEVPTSSAASEVATQVAAITSSASATPSSSSPASTQPPYPISSSKGSSFPTGSSGFITATRPTAASSASTASPSTGFSGVAKKYAQCGGVNWTGATSCESGSACTVQNDYYHQCT